MIVQSASRLSAQRALLGRIHPEMRVVDPGNQLREDISEAAAEIIADFPEATRIEEPFEVTSLPVPQEDGPSQFMLSNRRHCYPLTITDFASRYLVGCEALSSTRAVYAFSVFERIFKYFGLPKAIRTENCTPLFELSLPLRPHRSARC